MKESNKYFLFYIDSSLIDKSFSEIINTVSTSTISSKDTLSHRRTIKLHIFKKRYSSLSTEELWIQEPTTKEETTEWSKLKERDSKRLTFRNWCKTTWESHKNTKLNTWEEFPTKQFINTVTISKVKTSNSTYNFYHQTSTKLQLHSRTGSYQNRTGQDSKHSHYRNGITNWDSGQTAFNFCNKHNL